MQLDPNVMGASKRLAEMILQAFAENCNMFLDKKNLKIMFIFDYCLEMYWHPPVQLYLYLKNKLRMEVL